MNYGLNGSSLRTQPTVKRKVFVSYHHGGDQSFYDAFSTAFSDTYDVISDNSLERAIDSDDLEYAMRSIRENFISGSSCTIVLVGKVTWGRKYVDWEIEATLDKQHGLIGVQLPTLQAGPNGTVTVPDRLHDNIVSGYALWLTWAQFTGGAQACTGYIEQANGRAKMPIVNNRDRRQRNA